MENEIVKSTEIELPELFKKAIEKDASIETFERLMRIRQEVKEEIAKENFCLELSKLQEEIPPIPTDCEVKDGKGNIRYRYASLKKIMEVMQPLLSKHGFSISFETEKTEKGEIWGVPEVLISGNHKKIDEWKNSSPIKSK